MQAGRFLNTGCICRLERGKKREELRLLGVLREACQDREGSGRRWIGDRIPSHPPTDSGKSAHFLSYRFSIDPRWVPAHGKLSAVIEVS